MTCGYWLLAILTLIDQLEMSGRVNHILLWRSAFTVQVVLNVNSSIPCVKRHFQDLMLSCQTPGHRLMNDALNNILIHRPALVCA